MGSCSLPAADLVQISGVLAGCSAPHLQQPRQVLLSSQTPALPGLSVNAPFAAPCSGCRCSLGEAVCAVLWAVPGQAVPPAALSVPGAGAWPDVLREHRESAAPRGWVSSCTLCQGHCIGSGCEPAAKWSKRSADKGLFFICY